MSDIELKEEIEYRRQLVENIIEDKLPVAGGYGKTVIEAMNYSVKVGGKRIRPMLMAECYYMFGADTGRCVDEEALRLFMTAIECVHTYSLVHDDLPAMDNDMLRRGQPTTHAKFGEAMAILAGDALLNYAMELTASAMAMAQDDEVRRIAQTQKILFDRAGIYGMIGGQCADVEAEKNGTEASQQLLEYIHRNKTGALLFASMMIGAILGGADEEQQDIVAAIAVKIGLAFQIRDDILDIEGSEDVLGKPIGSDEKNGKLTYVSVYGMEKAKSDVDTLTEEALELLDMLPKNSVVLRCILKELTSREN